MFIDIDICVCKFSKPDRPVLHVRVASISSIRFRLHLQQPVIPHFTPLSYHFTPLPMLHLITERTLPGYFKLHPLLPPPPVAGHRFKSENNLESLNILPLPSDDTLPLPSEEGTTWFFQVAKATIWPGHRYPRSNKTANTAFHAPPPVKMFYQLVLRSRLPKNIVNLSLTVTN